MDKINSNLETNSNLKSKTLKRRFLDGLVVWHCIHLANYSYAFLKHRKCSWGASKNYFDGRVIGIIISKTRDEF